MFELCWLPQVLKIWDGQKYFSEEVLQVSASLGQHGTPRLISPLPPPPPPPHSAQQIRALLVESEEDVVSCVRGCFYSVSLIAPLPH